MKNEDKILESLNSISSSVKDLMDKDMLDLGTSACLISDGKAEYIDPLKPIKMRHDCISKQQVKQTKAFQSLSKMLQQMVLKRNNMVVGINHGYCVAKNIGFEEWQKITQTRYYNVEIIEELVNENKTT